MLYCNKCKDQNGWPTSPSRCHAPCEVCGKYSDCNEVPVGLVALPTAPEPVNR